MASPPRRPWTPTERPGDASYTSSVVYHGDHQVEESDVSSEKSSDSPKVLSPGGIEVATSRAAPPPTSTPIPSAVSATAPEVVPTSYQPYSGPGTRKPESSEDVEETDSDDDQDLIVSLRPQGLGLSESPGRYRLSQMPQPEPDVSPPSNLNRQSLPPRSSERVDESIPAGPRRLSQTPQIETQSDLPSVTGKSTRQISINILLINPNSTKSMTDRCLESVEDSLPINVTVYGFTATRPAPTAIESQTDAIMSTAACMKAILPIASKYDAFLVACYSHHPLITALREQLFQPVIGIMEASIYASRMCGSKFGIITTGLRSMHLLDAAVKNVYGMNDFSVGTESSRMGVLELESRSEEEVEDRLAKAATKLQVRGADCICLGCAGMSNMQKACQDAVGMHDRVTMVIDGVNMGVHFLIGLVRENLGTAKGGRYNTVSGIKR
jgi:Asp/Glu/hydantoin racemase